MTHAMTESDLEIERLIRLNADAMHALARIAEHRRRLIGSEAEVRAVYAECRSYAVDVVNAIFRAEPALAEELGMLGKEGA